jgi:hypothetical protein
VGLLVTLRPKDRAPIAIVPFNDGGYQFWAVTCSGG